MLCTRAGRRWCTEISKKRGVPSHHKSLEESGMTSEQAKLLRKVVRECRRLDRGAMSAESEEVTTMTEKEYKEEMKIAQHKALRSTSSFHAARYFVKVVLPPYLNFVAIVLFVFLVYYMAFCVPMYGDSMSFLPSLFKYIFWDTLWVHNSEVLSGGFDGFILTIKKYCFPKLYEY
eukprot:TRINITY_DN20925_c0_g1_i1.p1 TRINITY_DN20925_c0_g1~~TRINITY_DN20925_c0_g1_i1.p1  ORF type:complete len:175 (+),score=26.99 TRINITY_DN20925_c0_g1_i1:55-579(+)